MTVGYLNASFRHLTNNQLHPHNEQKNVANEFTTNWNNSVIEAVHEEWLTGCQSLIHGLHLVFIQQHVGDPFGNRELPS